MLNISSFKYEVVVLDLDLVDFRVGIPSIPRTSSSSSWAILLRSLWWLQPRSQGDFPGLVAGREKGGCGASCRSASAAFLTRLI